MLGDILWLAFLFFGLPLTFCAGTLFLDYVINTTADRWS